MIWRHRQVAKDRKAGMVFDWRRGHGSAGRLIFSGILTSLIFGGLFGYVQLRAPDAPVLLDRMAQVTYVDVGEKSNRWLAEVMDGESPFFHRWDVASSRSLTEEITRQLSAVSPRQYQPLLREIPLPSEELLLANLPGLGVDHIPPPEEVIRAEVVLPSSRWALSIKPVESSDDWSAMILDWVGGEEGLSEGASWTVLLGVDWRGRVLTCSPMSGETNDFLKDVLERLRFAAYPVVKRSEEIRWSTVEVRLVNLVTAE